METKERSLSSGTRSGRRHGPRLPILQRNVRVARSLSAMWIATKFRSSRRLLSPEIHWLDYATCASGDVYASRAFHGTRRVRETLIVASATIIVDERQDDCCVRTAKLAGETIIFRETDASSSLSGEGSSRWSREPRLQRLGVLPFTLRVLTLRVYARACRKIGIAREGASSGMPTRMRGCPLPAKRGVMSYDGWAAISWLPRASSRPFFRPRRAQHVLARDDDGARWNENYRDCFRYVQAVAERPRDIKVSRRNVP